MQERLSFDPPDRASPSAGRGLGGVGWLVTKRGTQVSKEVGKDNVERVKERWVASACGRRDVYTIVLTPVDTGVEKFDIVAEQGT